MLMQKLTTLLIFLISLTLVMVVSALLLLNFWYMMPFLFETETRQVEKRAHVNKNERRTTVTSYPLDKIDDVLREEEEFIQEDINIYYSYIQFLDKTDTYGDRDIL